MNPRDIRYTVTGLPMQAGSVPAPSPVPGVTPVAALENVPGSITVNVASSAQVRNPGTVQATWSITNGAGLTITPSSGTLAPGATLPISLNASQAGTYTLVMAVAGGFATGSGATVSAAGVAPPPPALSLSALGGLTVQVGNQLNFGVVLSNPGTLPLVGTPENVAGAATFVPSTVTWSLGDLNKAFAATWAASGSKSIRVTAPGGLVSNTLAITVTDPPPPPPPSPTLATLSGSSTATAGVAHTDTVTLDVAADQAYTVTWTRSNGATGPATSTIAVGQTAVSSSSTWAAAGSGRTVDFTISPSIVRAGRPLPVTVAASPTPPPPPPPPPAPSTGTPQPFTLTSSSSGTLPFAIGYAMSQGHVPSGQSLTFAGATAKLTVLSTWPDGSARHGIIAGTYTSAGSAVTVTPTVATVAAGTALTGAAVQSAMGANTAVFDAGAFGSATFSGADFASPFVTHAATDSFIEAIYRKQIGTDAHLVAWLALRVWSTGQVEALPWVENGYLNVSGPTNKSATYSFALGGSSRFSAAIDLKHHTRTPLVSGSLLSHWLGTDPGVVALHHAGYLQQTELVPTYAAAVAASASVVTALPSTYTALQAGSLSYSTDDMSSPGYQAPIGLLPEHDVLYLTAADSARAAVWAAVQRNGYSAGRYGIHYRDETTNRPPAFSTYPTLILYGGGIKDVGASSTSTVTPVRTGGDPPLWDTAHCPSVGFMAYLLTGRFYFMEEVQFAATAIHFSVTDWARGGGVSGGTPAPGYTGASGIVSGHVQLRAGAWWMRSLAQALCVTPTTDSLHAEFKASVQNTVNFHHAKYVAQANNPFGFVQPDVDYGTTGIYRSSPWMQDFYTAAFGYAKAMGLPLDATPTANLTALFAWMAQSVVGRLGTSSSPDWWYINAAPYTIAVAPTDTPDWVTGTGPWYANWRAMYDATAASEPGRGSVDGILTGNGEAFPETTNPSQWHNLQPALAYAVRHGVSGARAAYDRMVGATNWTTIQSTWASKPVWSVMPKAPEWRQALAVNQAVALSGTTIRYGQGPGSRLSYSGLANRDALVVLAATGGHNDCSDNGVDSLDLWQEVPAWTARIAPFASPVTLVNYYRTTPTVEPSSRHTYNHTIYNGVRGKLLLHGTRSPWGAGGGLATNASNGLDLTAWAWDAAGTVGDSGAGIVQDSAGRVYSLVPYFAMAEYDPVTNVKTTLAGFANEVTYPMAHDCTRDQFFQCSWGDGQGGGTGRRLYKYSSRFGTQTAITLNASAGATALNADTAGDCTMFYVAALDAYFYWTGSTLYKITPNSGTAWDVSIVSITGATLPAPSHAHTRACYVPSLRCMAYLPNDTGSLYVVRLA